MKLAIIVLTFAGALLAQNAATYNVDANGDKIPAPVAGKQSTVASTSEKKEAAPYGFRLGTVSGAVEFGGMYMQGVRGIHPALLGRFEAGLHKYVGVFMEGGYSRAGDNGSVCVSYYCASYNVRSNFYSFGGGMEVIGSNRSRVVPYGKFGLAYAYGTDSADVSGVITGTIRDGAGAPAILTGGGVRTYITHNVGINTHVSVLRTVGNYGGAWIFAPTVGVFFQSK